MHGMPELLKLKFLYQKNVDKFLLLKIMVSV